MVSHVGMISKNQPWEIYLESEQVLARDTQAEEADVDLGIGTWRLSDQVKNGRSCPG